MSIVLTAPRPNQDSPEGGMSCSAIATTARAAHCVWAGLLTDKYTCMYIGYNWSGTACWTVCSVSSQARLSVWVPCCLVFTQSHFMSTRWWQSANA